MTATAYHEPQAPVYPSGRVEAAIDLSKLYDLSLTEACVLRHVAHRAGPSCFQSQEGMADDLRMDVRTVGRALKRLEDLGLLLPKHRWGETTNYQWVNSDTVSPPIPTQCPTNRKYNKKHSPPSSKKGMLPVHVPVTGDTVSELGGVTEAGVDWYDALRGLPGFNVPLSEAKAWLDRAGFTESHADGAALALASKWGGPGWRARDVWGTFQTWIKKQPEMDRLWSEGKLWPERSENVV